MAPSFFLEHSVVAKSVSLKHEAHVRPNQSLRMRYYPECSSRSQQQEEACCCDYLLLPPR